MYSPYFLLSSDCVHCERLSISIRPSVYIIIFFLASVDLFAKFTYQTRTHGSISFRFSFQPKDREIVFSSLLSSFLFNSTLLLLHCVKFLCSQYIRNIYLVILTTYFNILTKYEAQYLARRYSGVCTLNNMSVFECIRCLFFSFSLSLGIFFLCRCCDGVCACGVRLYVCECGFDLFLIEKKKKTA